MTDTIAANEVTEAHRAYRPRGKAVELMYCRDAEVIMSGPAGTGKSRGCLEKLFACATKYEGMRGLILRKTRESLTESGLVTWEEKVVPKGHSCLAGPQRKLRSSYEFSNGSVINVGGMDKASKVMSTEYDIIFVQEAIEFTEDDWEACTTRLRNGKMPYQQIIADTNPSHPRHWIKQRANRGQLKMLESRHEDNPLVWDAKNNKPTPAGEKYLAILDALTGPRKPRLRHGQWVQAEGVVYANFDPDVHIVDRFDIPATWRRFLAIDFGFTNPFVCQWWAESPDGDLYRYREIYRTKRIVQDHADDIKRLSANEPRPEQIITDHDAEDRATLERHLELPTTPAIKDVSPGLQEVEARLRVIEATGKPRLFFLRDSLFLRDVDLADRKAPCCTEEEFDGYVWSTSGGRKKGEEPHKEHDHGLDALRYLVMARLNGSVGTWADVSFDGTADRGRSMLFDELPDGVFGAV